MLCLHMPVIYKYASNTLIPNTIKYWRSPNITWRIFIYFICLCLGYRCIMQVFDWDTINIYFIGRNGILLLRMKQWKLCRNVLSICESIDGWNLDFKFMVNLIGYRCILYCYKFYEGNKAVEVVAVDGWGGCCEGTFINCSGISSISNPASVKSSPPAKGAEANVGLCNWLLLTLRLLLMASWNLIAG